MEDNEKSVTVSAQETVASSVNSSQDHQSSGLGIPKDPSVKALSKSRNLCFVFDLFEVGLTFLNSTGLKKDVVGNVSKT